MRSAFSSAQNLVLLLAVMHLQYVSEMLVLFKVISSPPFLRRAGCACEAMICYQDAYFVPVKSLADVWFQLIT